MGKWHRKNLGTICHLAYGKNLPTTLFTSEGFKVFGANSIIGYYSKYTHEDAEVLVSCRGEYSGVINFSEPKSYITNNSIVCILKLDLDKRFLFYALKNIPRQTFVSGSAQPQVVIQDLENIELYYPESKPEQTRIAQILSTIDRAIAQTEALIAKYQRIKTGLMQDLLTRGIDEHGRIRSKATHRFVVKNGIEVPEEWEVRELGTLCEMKGRIGWQGYTVNDLSDDASDPTVIGGTQISKEHKLDFTKPVYLKRQKYLEAPEIFVKYGDIVLVKTGNTIGKTALIDQKIGDATINPNTVILRDFKDITNRFLYLVMISEYFQKSLWDFVFVGAQPSVNQTNMKTIKIPLPNPNEQIKIAGTFFALTNQIEAERIKLSKLQSLKTGLMQDLLSGRVRVKVKEEAAAC